MASPAIISVLRHIRRVSGSVADGQPADRQLLEDFDANHDEAAFAALVRRHGPMVLSVCRGVLGDVHAAEDAFQATFLVLARKAGAIRNRESVGGWLCQVARRIALRARARTADRFEREKGAVVMSSAEPWLDLSLRELRSAVHEEVGRLPEKYRSPVVLCHLEGQTQEEAARLLGVSGGVIKGRLERGRQRLRVRLTRRGLALPAGLFAAALAKAADAAPDRLAQIVVKTALVAAPDLAGVSAEVLDLAREATITMTRKLKIATVFLAAALGVAGAVGYPTWTAQAGDEPEPKAAATVQPQAPTRGETLHFDCRVTEKESGKPIAGATVVVRRSLLEDPEEREHNRIIEETKHTTDAEGKYSFTIPPEQSAKRYLYIELDVEHADYAARRGFGYALSMIRKNEKMGGRPFFENTELIRGTPVNGILLTPDGHPAADIKIQGYSVPERDKNEPLQIGSFVDTRTDASGRFRLPLTAKGFAVVWLLPADYVPSTHVLKENKRGDLGTIILRPGIRLRGKVLDANGQPLVGVIVNVESQDRNEAITEPVADQINRSGITDEKGEFAMRPLPPGSYKVQPAVWQQDGSLDRKEHGVFTRRPLPGVFVGAIVKLKDGDEPDSVEVRAVPHVVVEAQYFDSKGKPTRGHAGFVFGQLDKSSWFGETTVDKDGKMVALLPHGLEKVQIDLVTNEHGALRWRRAKGEPLQNARRIDLGTLTDDAKGIEIIRYSAPILLIKAKVVARGKPTDIGGLLAQFGWSPADLGVTAVYGPGRGQHDGKMILRNGRESDVSFEKQEDGRFRSEQLLPDEEVTVTAHAPGYTSGPVKIKVPEGETKEIEIALEKAPQKREDQGKDEKK